MDRGTRIFWAAITVLFSAALFFGIAAERKRSALTKAAAGLATGELATLVSVTDGDSVVLANSDGENVTVRILGIKAFEDTTGRDNPAKFGQLGVQQLKHALERRPIRVLLANPPKDKHGRTLAILYVDDRDVGLQLVRDGLVLVYTAYPFPGMQRYLEEQDNAQTAKKGLWADSAATARAQRMLQAWRKEAP